MTPSRQLRRRTLARMMIWRAAITASRALSWATIASSAALDFVETDFDKVRLQRAAQRLIAAAQEFESAINAMAMLAVFSEGDDHV